MCRVHGSARRHDLDGPRRTRRRRREARGVITCLVTKAHRHLERARRNSRRKRELDADRKRPLEHGERLIHTDLLEIDRRRKHHFLHGDAHRRINRQLGRDQIRVARFVRLDVEAFGKADRQRAAQCVTGMCGVGLQQWSDFCFDMLQLRMEKRSTTEDAEDPEKKQIPLCPLCPPW